MIFLPKNPKFHFRDLSVHFRLLNPIFVKKNEIIVLKNYFVCYFKLIFEFQNFNKIPSFIDQLRTIFNHQIFSSSIFDAEKADIEFHFNRSKSTAGYQNAINFR